ncbi:damage-inducible mutagenesis protein [Methylobacterium sp. Leaf102]|uniref:ImuA family protein n=1 Tax=Methylobacterium sp. Leaf102 TaxID=1736253 RepID=UPI0006F61FD6|nr:hypothetical protein [Methylobacterium sp. Leaf102]KQP21822.1 damage-inducible mutagenesis protein [Methylobacterium sp. Leaf102]
MTTSHHGPILEQLRGAIAGLERGPRSASSILRPLPFGIPTIDRHLPGGGLRLGALHEIVPGGPAHEHTAACILFTAGILARLPGSVLWCLSSRDLFAPGLARAGLHPDRVLYAETYREADLMPLIEEGVRFPGLAGVVGDIVHLSLTASRRLQLAAEETAVPVFLLRRSSRKAEASETASAAATRWRLSALSSRALASPGLARGRWQVELLRCRGAPAGTEACRWQLEACDETGHLALAADLADGSRPQAEFDRAAAG